LNTNIGVIDFNKQPDKVELYLAKNNPSRDIISSISYGLGAYNIKRSLKLGNISQLTFDIPYEVDINHNLIRNSLIDLIEENLLVKFVRGTETEWFIIDSKNENMSSDSDNLSLTCYSLCYELNSKLITDYNTKPTVTNVCYNLKQFLIGQIGIIEGILNNTMWSIGTIDNDLLYDTNQQEIKRTFSVSGSKTVLQTLFDLATTFEAVIFYDTEKRLLSFYTNEHSGIDRGLNLNYYNYLNTLSKETQISEIVTKLKVFGKDGITISSVNPTGSNYIEDYSYFMAGYDKKAGTHSPWMSDSLCEALINYRNVINNNKGNFQALLGQQNTLTTLLSIKQYTELSALQTELLKINSDIDIAQSINSSLSNKLLNRRSIIINQIDSKNIEITNLKNQLNNVSTQITLLQQVMSLENNLTQYQLRELNPFIFEKEFRDEKYTSDVVKDLYFAGVAQFHQLQLPKTTIKINIVDFLEIIECQNDWDKLNLGDLIYIEYPRFNLKVQAQITEMEQDYENRTVNLTISNIKDMETKEKTIIRLLYQTIGTSASVNTLTNQLNAAQQDLANIQDIINNVWNTAERKILSGVNDSVTINERGITTQPSTSSSKILRFNLGSLLGSNQGEDYLKVFIDGDGIKADKISGVLTVDDNSLKMEFKGSNIKKYFPNVNFDTLNSNSTSTNSTNEYVLSNDVGIKFLEALMTIYGGKLNINDNKGNNKIILEIDSTTNQPIITINNSDNTKTYTIKILSTGELQIGNDINNLTVSDTFTSLKAGNYIFNLNNSSVNIGNTSTGDYINLVNGNFTINCTGNISLNAGGTITANGNPI
jgi:predicted  nucleic acid-binding Zn-ribbon protein